MANQQNDIGNRDRRNQQGENLANKGDRPSTSGTRSDEFNRDRDMNREKSNRDPKVDKDMGINPDKTRVA